MQNKRQPIPNRQRSATTRAALLSAGRRLFVDKGFADTGTPEIVAAAGVTRGALYHHFTDKRALFHAVVATEAAAVAREIDAATRGDLPPGRALVEGGDAFLRAMREPGRTRLLLLEGPAILGRAEMDRIDGANGARTLREGLTQAMASGALQRLPPDALTAILSAAFDRAALAQALGAPAEDYRAVMQALIGGLAPK